MANPRELVSSLTNDLQVAFGEHLRAALLYGSLARGEYVKGTSDINVLILLDNIEPALLRRAAHSARTWEQRGVRPLMVEEAEWERARDVFGIELLDMRDAHERLHGENPLDGRDIDMSAVRLQAERELRARLIALHNGLLHTADAPKRLGQLLMAAVPSLTTYLRTALRLAGEPVPRDSASVIQAGTTLVGAPAAGLLRVYQARSAKERLPLSIEDPVVDACHAVAERTASFVDAIGRES
jgi:predicted nucleotidyltransferase